MKNYVYGVSAIALMAGQVVAEENRIEPQLEEIVVTGEKVARSLQDTPTSVAVLSDLKIAEQNIFNLTDAFDRIANVTSSFGGTSFTIRGINNLNVSGSGRGDLATIYIDGSPLPRNAILSGAVDVWDVEQIEVFRGPQSTLQGRNTLAGAVIVNTANPTYNWEGRVRASASTGQDERRLGVAVGGPIIKDQLAFRIAAEVVETDGVVRNTTTGGFADDSESTYIRAKLLWEPEAAPDLSVLLSYTRDEREFGGSISNIEDGFSGRTIASNRNSRDDVDVDIGVATIQYDFSDAVKLKSISAINVATRDRLRDSDFTAEDNEFFTIDSKAETFTQELQVSFDLGRFSGVIGGYYSDLDISRETTRSTFGIDLVDDLGLVNILVGSFGLDVPTATFASSLYSEPVFVESLSANPSNIETKAIFADFTYDLTDSFRVFGGFRYDNEEQEITTGNSAMVASGLPDPALLTEPFRTLVTGVNGFVAQQASATNAATVDLQSPSFNEFLPKFGIGWDIDDERSVSFTVQKGYRSGGVGINQGRAQAFTFDKETTWNYELAWRSRWLDNRLTFNANAFYIDWTDQQVNVQLSDSVFDFATQNVGSSRVYGFEAETNFLLTDTVEIYGSVGYANTRFDDFDVVVNGVVRDFSGNEFPNAPKWTVAGGATWRDDTGFLVNVNGNYQSAGYQRADQIQNERVVDSRFLVNFRAGWENENWGIFITGDNVFEDSYVNSVLPYDPSQPNVIPAFAQFGQPQSFAVQLEAKF